MLKLLTFAKTENLNVTTKLIFVGKYPSQHFLNQHKILNGHKRNRIEKATQDDKDTNIKKNKVQREFFVAKNIAAK